MPDAVVPAMDENEKFFVIRTLDGADEVDEVAMSDSADFIGYAGPEIERGNGWFVHHAAFLSRSTISS